MQERNLDVGEESAAVTAMTNVLGIIQCVKEGLKIVPDLSKAAVKAIGFREDARIRNEKKRRKAEKEIAIEKSNDSLPKDDKPHVDFIHPEYKNIDPKTGEVIP